MKKLITLVSLAALTLGSATAFADLDIDITDTDAGANATAPDGGTCGGDKACVSKAELTTCIAEKAEVIKQLDTSKNAAKAFEQAAIDCRKELAAVKQPAPPKKDVPKQLVVQKPIKWRLDPRSRAGSGREIQYEVVCDDERFIPVVTNFHFKACVPRDIAELVESNAGMTEENKQWVRDRITDAILGQQSNGQPVDYDALKKQVDKWLAHHTDRNWDSLSVMPYVWYQGPAGTAVGVMADYQHRYRVAPGSSLSLFAGVFGGFAVSQSVGPGGVLGGDFGISISSKNHVHNFDIGIQGTQYISIHPAGFGPLKIPSQFRGWEVGPLVAWQANLTRHFHVGLRFSPGYGKANWNKSPTDFREAGTLQAMGSFYLGGHIGQ